MFPSLYGIKGSAKSRIKYGLGVYIPYGLGATWDAFDLPDSMIAHLGPSTGKVPTTWANGFPEKEMLSSIGIVDIHPTVAFQLTDNLSFGMGLSILYGMIEVQKFKPQSEFIFTPPSTVEYSAPTTFNMKGTGLGIGSNWGLLYKVEGVGSVGVSGKLPANLKMEGDAEIVAYINSYVANFGKAPGTVAPYKATYKPNGKAELKLPGDVGYGMSVYVKPNWLLSFDYSFTFWERFSKVKIEIDSINILNKVPMEEVIMNTDWNNTSRFSLGTEYMMGNMAYRAGFFYDQSPIPDEALSPTWPDVSEKLSGNFGLGVQLGKYTIDTNYEYIHFAERKISQPTEDNLEGTYNVNVHALNLGLTYKF